MTPLNPKIQRSANAKAIVANPIAKKSRPISPLVIDFKYKKFKTKAKLIIAQPKAKTLEANPQLK